MGSDLKFLFIVVAALDGADVPVVSCLGIFGGQRKSGFESSLFGFPVDGIGKLHAIAGIARRQADGLNKGRVFTLALNLKRDAYRTVLNDSHLCRSLNIRTRRLLLVSPIHVPC